MVKGFLSVFNHCLNTNRDGAKSVSYMKCKIVSEQAESCVQETSEIEEKVRFDDDAASQLKISMSESDNGEMTYHVEVLSEEHHNSRFYELHNKDIATLASIFTSHHRAKNVEIIATSLNQNESPKYGINKNKLNLDTTHFQRLSNLNTLCIRLNSLLELSMSAPFYFPIRELCLVDVRIKLYDFGLLIRCVGHTLQHLCLERLKIIDSTESNDYLIQLKRIRSIQSVRIDHGLSEIYPSLSECVFSTLFVRSVSLEFLLNTTEFNLANTIYTQKLIYKNNTYGMNDIQTIDLILDEKQIRSRSIFKVKLVIGLPNSWLTRTETSKFESVLRIGNLEICRLDISSSNVDNLNRTLFSLKL